MRIAFLLLLFLSAQIVCFAQTSADVEALIRSSKLVETSRPLRVVTANNQITISTYVDGKAKDKDCKITAMLMMKEIAQKFPKAQSVKVNFFDLLTASAYRSVVIDRKLVSQVDGGKSFDSVLSGISVSRGTVQARPAKPEGKTAVAVSKRSDTVYGASTGAYNRFYCKRGNFSIVCPAHWQLDNRLHDEEVFKLGDGRQVVAVSIDAGTVESRLEAEEEFYHNGYPSYKKVSQGALPSKDKEGLLIVATFLDDGAPYVTHRAIFRDAASGRIITIELFTPESVRMNDAREMLLRMLGSFH